MSITVCILANDEEGPFCVVSLDEKHGTLSSKLVQKVDYSGEKRKCYTGKGLMFTYVIDTGTCIWVTSSSQSNESQKICYKLIEMVSKEWRDTEGTAREDYVRNKMNYCNSKDSKIALLQEQIEEVKQIALKDIDRLIEREGKLDELNIEAQNLQEGTSLFQKSSQKLRCQLLRENIIWTIAIIVGIVICLLLIVLVIAIAVGVTQNN